MEQVPHAELGEDLRQTLAYADRILNGQLDYKELEPNDESLDPSERFSGPIVDFNLGLSEQEKEFAAGWIKSRLGSLPEDASVKAKYRSFDEKTDVTVYDVPLGQPVDLYYLSQWQNEGEQPSYVLWQEEWYDSQLEEGYQLIDLTKPLFVHTM